MRTNNWVLGYIKTNWAIHIQVGIAGGGQVISRAVHFHLPEFQFCATVLKKVYNIQSRLESSRAVQSCLGSFQSRLESSSKLFQNYRSHSWGWRGTGGSSDLTRWQNSETLWRHRIIFPCAAKSAKILRSRRAKTTRKSLFVSIATFIITFVVVVPVTPTN